MFIVLCWNKDAEIIWTSCSFRQNRATIPHFHNFRDLGLNKMLVIQSIVALSPSKTRYRSAYHLLIYFKKHRLCSKVSLCFKTLEPVGISQENQNCCAWGRESCSVCWLNRTQIRLVWKWDVTMLYWDITAPQTDAKLLGSLLVMLARSEQKYRPLSGEPVSQFPIRARREAHH